jgi:serine/threonine protein kinase
MQALPALDSDLRQRFLQEAEITAKLDHPGIVPVYGLGRDSSGRPFYAMRFINGDNLGEVVKRFYAKTWPDEASSNLEFRRILQGVAAVCQTMAYAHARGVIHRDLKPGNIILGPFGETLVLDWGLARRLDSAKPQGEGGGTSLPITQEAVGLTATGAAEGSPAYMAPEQARGDWQEVGPATDVYALGATLYVVLTGRIPYDGTTATEVIEQVKTGRFQAPRRIKPAIPRPLEAVCLKAMAHRSADRYASPREIADDLQRWLADEPVSVWREPLLVRARRWVKKHRTMVSTAVGIVMVAVILLGAFGFVLDQKNRELRHKNEELFEANQALETSFDLLLESQKSELRRDIRIYGGSPDAHSNTPERLAELDTLVQRYQSALRAIPLRLTRLRRELAEQMGYALYHRARADPGAIADPAVRQRFDQARQQFRAVLDANPGNLSATTWLGLTHYEMGARWDQIGKKTEARAEYLSARTLLAAAVELGAPSRTRILLAELTLDLCRLGEQTKDLPAAQLWEWCSQARQVLETTRKNGAIRENEEEALVSLAKLRFNLILLGAQLGKVADPAAAAALAELLEDMKGDMKPPRPSADFELVRARIRLSLARFLARTGNADQARRRADEARQHLEAARVPGAENLDVDRYLCDAYFFLGWLDGALDGARSPAQAIAWLEKTNALRPALGRPEAPVACRVVAAHCAGMLAEVYNQDGPQRNAKLCWQTAREALTILDSLPQEAEAMSGWGPRRSATKSLASSAILRTVIGDLPPDEIRRTCEPARDALRKLEKFAGPLSHLEKSQLGLLETFCEKAQ